MKTTILSLLIAATLSATSTSSFASSNNATSHKDVLSVKPTAEFRGEPVFKGSENFVKAFPNAMVKTYETKGDVTKVSFTWNGDALEAFYNEKGELLATNHFLDPKNLPLSVRMKVQTEYEGYGILQATEFNHSETGLCYYLMVKNTAGKAFILQVDPNGGITRLKTLKK